MVKGGIRTTEEKGEKEEKTKIVRDLAETMQKMSDQLDNHEQRIKKLEDKMDELY